MISLAHLWLPILLSGVLVFIGSSLIHMVVKWHDTDYLKLPNEDEVRAAIKKGNAAPGQYVLPRVEQMSELAKPEVQQKFIDGPVALLTLKKPGPPTMGPSLSQWFAYSIVVSIFAGYVASRTLPQGAHYLAVFRVVGAVTFASYGLGEVPDSIWMGKPWRVSLKQLADSFFYGLLTAGAFGWLWPR